jgi:hypothetical protein
MQAPPEDARSGDIVGAETAPTALTRQQTYEARRTDYNKLVASARLLALILEKVDFKIQPSALSAEKSEFKRRLFPKTKIMSTGLDDGTCMANIIWEVDIKIKNKNVVKCIASYIISYQGVKDCSAEGVTVFLENVGKVATYAYFRALYSQLDWAASLNSEPLPVIQFLPNFRMSSENAGAAPEGPVA